MFDFEKEALLASGIKDDEKIAVYRERLHYLHEQFILQLYLDIEPLQKAKQLFDWLWTVKPYRYKLHGNYRLSDVIDNQINEETRTVGNCLGLTLLYNCLLRIIGLEPEALYMENAFEIGPHVLTRLQTKHSAIDIENIFADGFDYKGHINNPMRTVWGPKELVADIYHSQGNELFEKGDLSEALNNYKTAIDLNPQYEKVHLNIVILSDRIKMEKETGKV